MTRSNSTELKQLLEFTSVVAADYVNNIDDRPVKATVTSDQMRSILGGPLPENGDAPVNVIDTLAAAAVSGTLASSGPRFFGFVIGGNLPAAMAADWLVSAWDQNSALFSSAPLVSVIEEITAAWLKQLAALPDTMSVGFVTGCQMASFTGLAAARHHVLRESGWDVEAQGLNGAPPITIITSDESHYTIFMALRLLGFGAATAKRVPTDEHGRMRADEFRKTLAQTTGAVIVCAQAGNVNTGAFDPIDEIADAVADARRTRPVWLHVDGAFGLWASTSEKFAHLAKGIARADSIAADGHKWLNVPYDSGIVFCAHPLSHRGAMSLAAAYIQADAVERDPHEFVPEESRRGRGVPIYAALRSLGASGIGDMVERCCEHATHFAARLSAHPHVRVLNDVVLNQVLVRFETPGKEADKLTRDVIAGVQNEGTCWLGGTTWHGMAAMRIAVSNWSTTTEDVDRSADAILRVFEAQQK